MFNDRDEQTITSLQTAFSQIKGIQTLKYRPKVYCAEVGEKSAKSIEKMAMIRSLFLWTTGDTMDYLFA